MKTFLTVLVLCLVAICSSLPVDNNKYENTLESVDNVAQGDSKVDHVRLTRQFFGGLGGYGLGGYGLGGYGLGGLGGYGIGSGFGGGYSSSQSYSSAGGFGGGGGFFG